MPVEPAELGGAQPERQGLSKTQALSEAADACELEFRLGGTYERLVKELFTLSTSQMATMPLVV